MKEGFYSKKSALGVPNALILLMLVFFFIPFAARGARMALQKTENNVKDWLPADFRETEELAWFAKKFVSEQFVVATWSGCDKDDQRLKMFISKLQSERAPTGAEDVSSDFFRAKKLGAEYALFVGKDYATNWGGKDEKWLTDENGRSYYVTPDGRLYRWDGSPNLVSAAWRAIARATGSFHLEGQFVAGFGDPSTDAKPNPFWADPRLLSAPLFKTIETGPEVVERLAGNGGSLSTPTEPTAGKRDAIARLTGTLYGPPVPAAFSWKSEDLPALLDKDKLAELPKGWQDTWDLVVQRAVDANFAGDLAAFQNSDPVDQSRVWYDFFDAIGVPEPNRQTSVVLTLSDPARRNLGRVIGRGMLGQTRGRLFDIGEECGIAAPAVPTTAPPPFSWLAAKHVMPEPVMHIGGPPVDNVAIDEEGTITLVRLIGYSLALGLGLSLLLLRSVKLMMMVFFVGGVSAMASLSLVWWGNASVDAILLTMPSLVYVLGMAGAVHIINYYRDAVVEGGQTGAAERAIKHAIMPCTLAALTTAIGLMSLCSSNILPIRKFGIFSAMGVIATLALLFFFLPSALTIFPPASKKIKDAARKGNGAILNFWEAMGGFIIRRHWYVNAVCIALLIGLGFGLFRIKTSVQLLKLFDGNSQIIRDYAWLEENFGRLVPMELVVRFPESLQRPSEADESLTADDLKHARTQLSLLERAEAVSRIQSVMQDEFGYKGQNIVGRGMSAITFLRDIPDPSRGFDWQRTAFDRLLQKSRPELLDSDYLALETASGAAGAELWRISLRLGALNDVDYGEFVKTLRTVVEPVVTSYRVRHEVLEAVVEDAKDSQGRIVGNVLVLGHSGPNAVAAANDSEPAPGVAAGSTDSVAPSQALSIFVKSLSACLTNESIKVTWWHDPKVLPLTKEAAVSSEWADYIKRYSCVVIADPHPDYNLDFIREQHPHVIDASALLSQALVHPESSNQNVASQPVQLATHAGQMDVVYTGVVPVVYKAQRTLLVSLIESVAWAFVLIAVVMACLLSPARTFWAGFQPRNLFQGVGAGAISMVPNIFPVVAIFGIMGHMGTLVDIGSMMTASVAMGVAVDDTIHFLTWFRDGLRRGLDRRQAIFVAYKHVAPAMTQTTIIGGLGLSVFALSTFTPTQRFGTLMLSLLGAALVGDLIFLPALLASPLGRIFTVRPDKSNPHSGKTHLEVFDSRPVNQANHEHNSADRADREAAARAEIKPPKLFKQHGSHLRRRI
ncbi:MAG: MMPL family transporter [Pirellulaceae bacterium]|nr:MMPL family transporter [Pirellulaceae bacterium]